MEHENIFAPQLFAGKSALITGGGTGIGLTIARLLGSLGAHVMLVGRTKETLEQAVSDLQAENIHADFIPANIRAEQEVAELFEAVSGRWGGCDFLVNNAGGQFAAPALDISAKDRKRTRLNSSHVSISYAVFCLKQNI